MRAGLFDGFVDGQRDRFAERVEMAVGCTEVPPVFMKRAKTLKGIYDAQIWIIAP